LFPVDIKKSNFNNKKKLSPDLAPSGLDPGPPSRRRRCPLVVVESVPSTPSHAGLPRHRPLRQTSPVGSGTVKVGSEAAVESVVERAPRSRSHHRAAVEVVVAGTRLRSPPPGRGKARGHRAGSRSRSGTQSRSRRRDEVEVAPPGRGQSCHSTEAEVTPLRRGGPGHSGGASHKTRRHVVHHGLPPPPHIHACRSKEEASRAAAAC
jgi:hypothetical protein